ncbi:unnamed protein product [Allacma fusca]|uniref:Uncharacterized protein n=1 Tax=Allacma fusca TaxID=39272 RepID=A0A8J2K6H2_9HEXA|nr:unnamed protein product [Allacma fusca]
MKAQANCQIFSLVFKIQVCMFVLSGISIHANEKTKQSPFFISHQTSKKLTSLQDVQNWSQKQEGKMAQLAKGPPNNGKSYLLDKPVNNIITAPKSQILDAFSGDLKKTGKFDQNGRPIVWSNKKLPNILMEKQIPGQPRAFKNPDLFVSASLDRNGKPIHFNSVSETVPPFGSGGFKYGNKKNLLPPTNNGPKSGSRISSPKFTGTSTVHNQNLQKQGSNPPSPKLGGISTTSKQVSKPGNSGSGPTLFVPRTVARKPGPKTFNKGNNRFSPYNKGSNNQMK